MARSEIIELLRKYVMLLNTKIEPFFIGDRKFREDNTSPLISMVKDKGIEIV